MEHHSLAIGLDGKKKRIVKKETKRRKPPATAKPRTKASSSKRTSTQQKKKRSRASTASGKGAGHDRNVGSTTGTSDATEGVIDKISSSNRTGKGDHDSDDDDNDPLADREFVEALVSHVPGQLYRDPAYMTRVKHADPHGWWDRNMVCVTPSDWLTSDVAPLMAELLQGQECFADLRIIANGFTGMNIEAQSASLERAGAILASIAEGLPIEASPPWQDPLAEALGNVRRAAESMSLLGMLVAAMQDRTNEALSNERAFRLAVAAKLRDVMRSGRATLVHHDTLPTSIFHMRATNDGPHGSRGRGK